MHSVKNCWVRRKLLILPGTSNPFSSGYKEVYQHISNLANSHGYESMLGSYPGHGEGNLTFEGAIAAAQHQCAEYKPVWVIARSFGCDVAAEILSADALAQGIEGAILWGPTLGNWARRFFPTAADRRKEIAQYREYGANLADDFLDNFPALELIIEKTRCNIRLIRGTKDTSSFREDLDFLAAVHKRGQPSRICEVVEIPGVSHTIVPAACTDRQLADYSNALFRPFIRP